VFEIMKNASKVLVSLKETCQLRELGVIGDSGVGVWIGFGSLQWRVLVIVEVTKFGGFID
jgi:hypothetical protein